METKQKTTLTQGSVARGMLLFALPIFISNLFQQLYNAADSLIVGNFLGGEALAAVGSSGTLIFLLTGFVNGVSLGAGVVVARYFGAKDWDRMRRTIHTTVALGLVAGVGLTVIGVILTPQILRWMGTPDDVLVNSIAYFRMYFIGSIAVVMYNVGASILQSVGDSKSPMRYLIAASLINIVLDLILVGWLHMGVAAAAFATIASQTVSAVLAFAKLTRSQETWAVHWSEVKFDGPSLKAVIVQGLPSGIQNSVISIANVIVQSNINSFGKIAMAAYGAYSKLEGFAFLPVTSFTMALTTFVSQNLGAGLHDRAKKGSRFGIIAAAVIAELRRTFRPEFLNRVDETIVFRRLSREDCAEIARRLLAQTVSRAAALGITLEADEDCAVSLAERGYDVSYGARPLRRLIRGEVEDALATCLLDGTLASGDTAVLAAENGTLCVRRREKAAAAALGDVGAQKA